MSGMIGSRTLISALFCIVLCAAAFVYPAVTIADDKASGPPSNELSFQRVWVGEWSGFFDPSVHQDVTVTIGPEIREGVFEVVYAWGEAGFGGKNISPGKVKTEGTVDGDKFLFSWKNKQGRNFEMILQKQDGATLKARLEWGGPLGPV